MIWSLTVGAMAFRAGSRGIIRSDVRRRRFSALLEPSHHAFAKQRFRFAEESCVHVREDTVQIASNPQGHGWRQTPASRGTLDQTALQTIRDRGADPEAAVPAVERRLSRAGCGRH